MVLGHLTRAGGGPTVGTMLARTIDDLPPLARAPRVLVPTMGALHAGHAALIAHARTQAAGLGPHGLVVASVFVNPSQFNEPSDFERYPRDLERDVDAAISAGADAVYAPTVEEVYPPGREIPVGPLPAVATEPGLEDRFRPGHFAGVQQVVRRLFELIRPAVACFGEKDWQQLAVIRAMVEAEGLAVRIEPVPTVREASGLALSSRNRLLTPEGLGSASAIARALAEATTARTPHVGEDRMKRVLNAAGLRTEYAVIRDASTLATLAGDEVPEHPARALIAAWVEGVRLIDNAAACTSTRDS